MNSFFFNTFVVHELAVSTCNPMALVPNFGEEQYPTAPTNVTCVNGLLANMHGEDNGWQNLGVTPWQHPKAERHRHGYGE